MGSRTSWEPGNDEDMRCKDVKKTSTTSWNHVSIYIILYLFWGSNSSSGDVSNLNKCDFQVILPV